MSVTPRVSVLMANWNGGRFIEASLRSALRQTVTDLEIIVADDASTDDSLAIAERIAASDARVRVLRSSRNTGISATRNRAIEAARGAWLAVQDSDDLLHPERLARLLAIGEADGADIVADDLLEFPSDDDGPLKLLVGDPRALLFGTTRFMREAHVLGYLKPIWRAEAMGARRYNTDMIVAEDFDLVCRMMVGGARYRFHPEAMYFYRKHRRSISSGSDRRKQRSILDGDDRFRRDVTLRGALRAAANARRRTILRHMAYDDARDALLARRWGEAVAAVARRPSSALVFGLPLRVRAERVARRLTGRKSLPASERPSVLFLARHPPGADGGGAFARALSRAAAARGWERRLVLLPARADRATAAASAAAPTAAPDASFDLVAVSPPPDASGDPRVAVPARQALFVAAHARATRCVVALDPSLAAFLPYRVFPERLALVVEPGQPAPDASALARFLDGDPPAERGEPTPEMPS